MSTSPVIPLEPDDQPSEIAAPQQVPDLYELLPIPIIDLSDSEKSVIERYQIGKAILGPVSSAILTCPPPPPETLENGQVSLFQLLEKNKCCPYLKSCPLLKQGKAPHGEPCPLETTYTLERFQRWSDDLGKTPYTLNETDRVAASELTSIDLTEHRCLSILGEAENARLTDVSVKETSENGLPLAYEKVIHINQQILEGVRNRRTKILHDYELTPEMKTKKKKYETGEKGVDLASLQSARADKVKAAMERRRARSAAPA